MALSNVNGTKIIRRYSPFLLAYCVLGIALVACLLIYLLFPIMTLSYTEAGEQYSVSVTGYSFLKAFFTRINTSTHTELGDSFLTFIRNQRGTTLNSMQSFLINGCGGRMEQITMCTFAGCLLLIFVLAAFEVLTCVIGIIFGRLHYAGAVKGLGGGIVAIFSFAITALVAFKLLYSNIIDAVVANETNSVAEGNISSVIPSVVVYFVIMAEQIALSMVYSTGIRDRVFVRLNENI